MIESFRKNWEYLKLFFFQTFHICFLFFVRFFFCGSGRFGFVILPSVGADVSSLQREETNKSAVFTSGTKILHQPLSHTRLDCVCVCVCVFYSVNCTNHTLLRVPHHSLSVKQEVVHKAASCQIQHSDVTRCGSRRPSGGSRRS